MSTLSPRLSLVLPDDGGAGGDDLVDVTLQISNNFAALDSSIGIYYCTLLTRPTQNLFAGRLIIQTDTNEIFRYDGATWVFVQDTEWKTYSPADIWVGSGSQPVAGAGSTKNGRYFRVGKKCTYTLRFNSGGAGLATAAGNLGFKLPVAAGSQFVDPVIGTAHIFYWASELLGYCTVSPNATSCNIFFPNGTSTLAALTTFGLWQNQTAGGAGTGLPLVAGQYTWDAAHPGLVDISIEYPTV